jgi:hypothetical protein
MSIFYSRDIPKYSEGKFDVVSDLKVSRRRPIWHLLRKTLVPESVRKNFFV